MIPKIIHYCWFGGKQKPQDVQACISSWRRVLPDYEIKEWNEQNFSYKKYRYTLEAYSARKYAFVSDVCRLYALYVEGGIYLDTDVEIVKSFDPFLDHQSFVGYEVENRIGTGVIGAVPHLQWVKMLLQQYENLDFVSNQGFLDLKPNTQRVTMLFSEYEANNKPIVYPEDFFCAKDYRTEELFVTENTVAVHNYKSSWNNSNIHPLEKKEQIVCALFHIPNKHLVVRLFKRFVRYVAKGRLIDD